MDEVAITQYITGTFDGVEVVAADGTSYFFFDPEHKMPFATLVTNDLHDTASALARPSVFRLNVGVHKETYVSLWTPSTGI